MGGVRFRRLHALGVAVIAAVSVAGVAQAWTVVRPVTVDTPAERLAGAPPAAPSPSLLTSDSAWLAISAYGTMDAVQGFDHWLALASCRRRVTTSCRNYDSSVPETSYEVIDRYGDEFDVLIQAAGYDDGDRDFVSDVERTIALTRRHGYARVVWVTLRANVTYNSGVGFAEVYERNNASIKALRDSGDYPELVVADWAGYAHDRSEWFSSDGIHMNTLGAYAAADYISRKMAFLEQRPCPHPPAPGLPNTGPCPDPDVTGPINDIAALYPTAVMSPESRIGTDEYLIFEGEGSWPDPPWWSAT